MRDGEGEGRDSEWGDYEGGTRGEEERDMEEE